MPTSNLIVKSLGKIEYGSGNGEPDHVAPRGSFYINDDTGKIYINADGTVTGWTSLLKPQTGEIYLQSSVTSTQTGTNSWTAIQGSATVSVFTSDTFTYSSQLTLISATGDGGFESSLIQGTAGFESNGWVVNNGSQAAKWYVGTTGASGSGYGAYVSTNNGASNTYNNGSTTTSRVYFYRDVTVPAYVTNLTLRFSIRTRGESLFDFVNIYNSTPAIPFTAGAQYTNQIAQYVLLTGYPTQTVNITLTASSTEQTRRIAFGWLNDASAGQDPPASIDNISLVANLPVSLTYTGSQSTFRSLLTGSFQAGSSITNVGIQIAKNTLTASNISETSFNVGTNFKDSFSTQNIFTMSSGDVVRPLISNKVSSASISVNDLYLGLWEIE